MRKPTTPELLAIDILERSTCHVQVGAVIADRHGIFAWGWNHSGDGWGQCAEQYAINRANHKRLVGASIYVTGKRKRNGHIVNARPCDDCLGRIRAVGIRRIYYRSDDGLWKMEISA